MAPIKPLYFLSGSKRLETGENTVVCIASLLSSSGHYSAYLDNIHLKLSKDAYIEVRFHPMSSKHENSKNRFS